MRTYKAQKYETLSILRPVAVRTQTQGQLVANTNSIAGKKMGGAMLITISDNLTAVQ